MTLQEKSLATIELPKILEMLAAEAATPPAKELCRQLRPETSLTRCEKMQEETDDASKLIGLQGSPAFSGVKDISHALDRAEKGGFLNPVELLAVGALLRAACMMGVLACSGRREVSAGCLDAARTYATELGMAFQIQDDILDATATTQELGKPVGSDEANGKTTYVTLFGVEECEKLVLEHTNRAKEALKSCTWPGGTEFLTDLADYLALRGN